MNVKKALIKTMTWKAISSVIFFILLFIFTNSAKMAGELAAIDFVLKAIAYYFHELAWQKRDKSLELADDV